MWIIVIMVLIFVIIVVCVGTGFAPGGVLAAVALIFWTLMALATPGDSYEPPVLVKENVLMYFNEDGKILSISPDDKYTYRLQDGQVFTLEAGEKDQRGNLIICSIQEQPECKVPMVFEYSKKGTMSKWNLGVVNAKEYIFIVPEGTIDVK